MICVISLIAFKTPCVEVWLPLNKIIVFILDAFSLRLLHLYYRFPLFFGKDNFHSSHAAEAGFVPCELKQESNQTDVSLFVTSLTGDTLE
jgi:hypothetical protein